VKSKYASRKPALTAALLTGLTAALLAGAVFPGAGLAAGLDDIEFASDIRLRWRWVDSGSPGPLRSTYGEFIQRGISLKHRFVFDVTYPMTPELRIGGRLRVSNEPQMVLETGPEYYSSEFGTAFIAYETPALTSRFGFYETYYTPLTLMRWDLKDDAEGGGCPVCSATPGTAGAILGESLEILGPVLTFEGLSFKASPGDVLGLDVFYARPKVARETDYGLMRQVNTYGGRLDLSTYLERASGLLSVGLIGVRSEEDQGSVESVDGSPVYPLQPYKNSVYGLTLEAPVVRWLTIGGDVTYSKTEISEGTDEIEKKGAGGILSLDVRTGGIRWENAYVYITPDWESYFRALSYNPDRKGWRSRFVLERETWLVSLFARHLISVNRVSGEGTDRSAYPTWSIQGSFKPRSGVLVSGSVVYTGTGIHEGAFDFAETSRLYSYVIAIIADVARGTKLTIENRYLNSRDYEAPEFNYNANMFTLYLRAEIW
jgi:hypothetical protein